VTRTPKPILILIGVLLVAAVLIELARGMVGQ